MGDPIINTQVDAINTTLGNIKVDLAALRPSIRAIKDAIAETYITDTIENVPIASFSDGADGIPVADLKVAIEPIQNLNGQTSPYPAGGGKNKLGFKDATGVASGTNKSVTIANELVRVNASGNVASTSLVNTTAMPQVLLGGVLPAGTYAFSISSLATNKTGVVANSVKLVLSDGTSVLGGASFTLSAEATVSAIDYNSSITWANGDYVQFKAQIESGSSPTEWQPYSNICPISGHTEVNVVRAGKNYVEFGASASGNGVTLTNNGNGTISTSGTASAIVTYNSNPFEVLEGEVFYLEGCPSGGSSSTFRIDIRDGSSGSVLNNGDVGSGIEYTVPNGVSSLKVSIRIGTGTNVDGLVFKPVMSLKETRQTYPISLGQTVYGGTLNVTTGVLTIDRAMVDLGTLTWNANGTLGSNYEYAVALSGKANGLTNMMCSSLAVKSTAELNCIRGRTNSATISAVSAISTKEAFKTAMSGVQLVYELATPTTVQLTAAEVETLFGQNNVWSDTNGNIVKLTYRKAWEIALAQGE